MSAIRTIEPATAAQGDLSLCFAMSHVARIEAPGMFHLVEQRVRRDLHAPLEFHDRHLSLATLHASIYKYGIHLC